MSHGGIRQSGLPRKNFWGYFSENFSLPSFKNRFLYILSISEVHMGVTTGARGAAPSILRFSKNLTFLSPFEAIFLKIFSLAPLASYVPCILPLLTSVFVIYSNFGYFSEKFFWTFFAPPSARNDVKYIKS